MATAGGSVTGRLGDPVLGRLGCRALRDHGGPSQVNIEARTLDRVGSVDTIAHSEQGTEDLDFSSTEENYQS